MRNSFLYAVAALCLTGCGEGKEETSSNVATFDFNDFQEVDLSATGEQISDDPDVLGIVTNIKVVDDSIIAICQNAREAHVTLYNLNTGQTQIAVKRGEGPDEMLRVTTLSCDADGRLWMSGLMDRKIMTTRWNPDGDEAVTELKIKSPVDLLRGVTDGKGDVYGLPATKYDTRVIRVDASGVAVDSLGGFPNTEMPDSIQPSNFIFQSDMALCPSNGMMAIACKSWNEIDVYSLADGSRIALRAPVDDGIKIEKSERGIGVSYNPRPMWFMFSRVSAGDKSFLVGYIGVKAEKDEDFNRGIGKVLEFDWKGQPVKQYVFGNEAIAFDADFQNGYLYTVENNPDPILMRYKL
ncbi:MAG: TolB-like 6-bladed beta-propeller domain-containing protein [Staphylococcus sp.]|nr:TolB-like 6-bladed beta-propeller domain-containing protein [Staphylococcus sp.]